MFNRFDQRNLNGQNASSTMEHRKNTNGPYDLNNNFAILKPGRTKENPRTSNSFKSVPEDEIMLTAKTLGFSEILIKKVIERRFDNNLEPYRSAVELIGDLQIEEERTCSKKIEELAKCTAGPSILPSLTSAQKKLTNIPPTPDPLELLSKAEVDKKILDLENESRCKICLDSAANCLFMPCRHICSCLDCARAIRNCPFCRAKLTKIIKVYR